MTTLTIFTAPKPFTDAHIAIIQRNAIQSWRALGEDVKVILVGDEPGMAATAKELGVTHLPDVATNEKGTPLVSSIFANAQQVCDSKLMAYVNTDVIVLPEFLEVANQIAAQLAKFLVVGQRWDLEIKQPLDIALGWQEALRRMTIEQGQQHVPSGSDFFIFPRGLLNELPDFAIGRAGWDNWMIYHGTQQPWPVIDATSSIMVIHQNHDYAHLPGGVAHYKLDETFENAEMGGGMANMYMILDTDKEYRNGRIQKPRFRLARLIRKMERAVFPKDGVQSGPRWGITRRLRRLRRRFV